MASALAARAADRGVRLLGWWVPLLGERALVAVLSASLARTIQNWEGVVITPVLATFAIGFGIFVMWMIARDVRRNRG